MARTALTPYQLVRDAGVAVSTGAVDATNGNIVAVPGPFRARIVVQNSDASSHMLPSACTNRSVSLIVTTWMVPAATGTDRSPFVDAVNTTFAGAGRPLFAAPDAAPV